MQATRKLLLIAMLLSTSQAMACKVLVKYPEHLDVSTQDVQKYYVVSILKVLPDGYEGEIQRAFGGKLLVGSKVSIRYLKNEESHAICQNAFKEHESYLVRAEAGNSELTLSRYNWLNVPTSHEKYAVYVQDLAARTSR